MSNITVSKQADHTNHSSGESYTPQLQEDFITCLCFNDEVGRILADIVKPNLFQGDYSDIAARALDYWQEYKQAPKENLGTMFEDVLTDPNDSRQHRYRQLWFAMYEHSKVVNAQFVLDRLHLLQRRQALGGAVIKVAEYLDKDNVVEAEQLWQEQLDEARKYVPFSPGRKLTDLKATPALPRQGEAEFSSGIQIFDDRQVVPERGKLTLLLGVSGKGKTWQLIHYGKLAMLLGKKVMHITLEVSEDEVVTRYRQGWFSVPKREPKRPDEYEIVTFQRGSDGHLRSLERDRLAPEFTLDRHDANKILNERLLAPDKPKGKTSALHRKLNNFYVKQFPGGSLTSGQLRAFLRSTEQRGFKPDLILVDYVGIMHLDAAKEVRHELGRNMLALRALALELDVAVITAMQSNRAGAKAETLTAINVAEDWSLIHTADTIISYSQTDPEQTLKLARLRVDKQRDGEGGFEVAISQCYACGQFALDAVLADDTYKTMRDKLLKPTKVGDTPNDGSTPKTRDRVSELLKQHEKQVEIAKELGIDPSRVSKIKKTLKNMT